MNRSMQTSLNVLSCNDDEARENIADIAAMRSDSTWLYMYLPTNMTLALMSDSAFASALVSALASTLVSAFSSASASTLASAFAFALALALDQLSKLIALGVYIYIYIYE